MNFWRNVLAQLEAQGKTRKELAIEAGFDSSIFSKGEKSQAIPNAETALKIARCLNVSLESLLEMDLGKKQKHYITDLDLNLCKKYYKVIKKLESFPEYVRVAMCTFIMDWTV